MANTDFCNEFVTECILEMFEDFSKKNYSGQQFLSKKFNQNLAYFYHYGSGFFTTKRVTTRYNNERDQTQKSKVKPGELFET